MQYAEKLAGCFIVDNNLKWWRKSNWSTSNNANARGIAFSNGDYAFILYMYNYSTGCIWGPSNTDELDDKTYPEWANITLEKAITEEFMNGVEAAFAFNKSRASLPYIISRNDNYHAPEIFDGGNWVVKGSSPMCGLPSAWELAMCDLNYEEITDLLNYISGDDFEGGYGHWWTALQADKDNAIGIMEVGSGYGLSTSAFAYRPKSDTTYGAKVVYRAWPEDHGYLQ